MLLNRTKNKALGEALDISNAIPRDSDFTVVGTDNYSEIINSKVIIIAASTGTYVEDRNQMMEKQIGMSKDIGCNIRDSCRSPIVLVVSNPVDILTYTLLKETDFSRNKVIGIASSLDSNRFRYFISKKIGVKNSEISNARVIGEHGDSLVPIFSKVRIKEKKILDVINSDQKAEITREVRDYWKTLRNFKGRSHFGIAKNTVEVIESIIKNQTLSISASVFLKGEFDEKDVCIGVPVKITSRGIIKIEEVDLNKSERGLFKESARIIRNNIRKIQGMD